MKLLKILINQLILFFVICNFANASQTTFLVKPTGKYAVSMKKYRWINTDVCPDFLYNKTNEWFFEDNPNHCHVLDAYVYYPTNYKGSDYLIYDSFKPLVLKKNISDQVIKPENIEFAKAEASLISKRLSYVFANKPIVKSQKFPLIIFQPGFGVNSNYYQNYIDNLVSNGYVVIAIDSAFNVLMPSNNGETYLDSSNRTNESGEFSILQPNSNFALMNSDFNFVLNNIQKINDPLFKQIDFTRIGGLGHSFGALSLYEQSKDTKTQLKAIATLDVGGDKSYLNYNTTLPFLYLRAANASQIESNEFGASSKFILNHNNYLVLITNNEKNSIYSTHMSFTDYATTTLDEQMMELDGKVYNYQFDKQQQEAMLGTANGFEITRNINTYLLNFFDQYLKDKVDSYALNKCQSMATNSILYCNSGVKIQTN